MIFKAFVVIYILGILLTALYMERRFWRKSRLQGGDQQLATHIACVVVSLLWLPFFGRVVWQMTIRGLRGV